MGLLQYKSHSCVLDGLTNPIGFVPDDDVDVFYRDYRVGCRDHVRQQRLSANFMQHLRML